MNRKSNSKATNPTEVETLRRIRKDWGDVKPYTRIETAKKSCYDRKQSKKLEREARYDYN